MFIAVKFNKSYQEALKGKSKRKSIKDMVLKYWKVTGIMKKVDLNSEQVIILGIVKNKVYAAFKVYDWRIVDRLNKKGSKLNGNEKVQDIEGIYSPRVEFFATEDLDKYIGLCLDNRDIGGWSIKKFGDEDIENMLLLQINVMSQNRKAIISERDELKNEDGKKVEYNPNETYEYDFVYYANKVYNPRKQKIISSTHKRSNYTCELCHAHKPIQIECHHIELISKGGLDCIENTISLCEHCHTKIHKDINEYENMIKPILQKIRMDMPNCNYKYLSL